MTGVTILNEYACLNDFRFLIWFAFGVVVLIISTIVLMDNKYSDGICSLLIACLLFIASVLGYSLSKVSRLEALVDASVPAVELMERYKIIERKGDIWVLEPLISEATENET